MSRARTLEDIYQAALDALAQGLGVVRSAILLFDPDGVMRFKASRNLSEAYQQAVEGHTPWRPDTPDPRPIVVSDVGREPSLQPYLEIIAAEGIAGDDLHSARLRRQGDRQVHALLRSPARVHY